MDQSGISPQIYEHNNLKDPWFNAVKTIIHTSGQYSIWDNQVTFFNSDKNVLKRSQNYILQTLVDLSMQFSSEKIESESKLYLYKNDTNHLGISKYLSSIFGRERRSALSNLRLGTTDLELEKGRHRNIPRDARYCKNCNSREVEDETHFLFKCPAFDQIRKPFIEKICETAYHFRNLNPTDKTKYLYFNTDLRTDHLNIAADMLINLTHAKSRSLAAQQN